MTEPLVLFINLLAGNTEVGGYCEIVPFIWSLIIFSFNLNPYWKCIGFKLELNSPTTYENAFIFEVADSLQSDVCGVGFVCVWWKSVRFKEGFQQIIDPQHYRQGPAGGPQLTSWMQCRSLLLFFRCLRRFLAFPSSGSFGDLAVIL